MIRKEPAMLAGGVAAVVSLALVYGVVDEKQAAAWTSVLLVVLPLVQGLVTRFLVFSPNTVDEMVEAGEAATPAVPPKRKRASR